MKFLVNDLSMDGQFHNLAAFQEAIARIMTMRKEMNTRGCTLHCDANLLSAQVTSTMGMQRAVNHMPEAPRRSWMGWLTRQGPFWESDRLHQGDDYLEANGKLVTDHASGEAAVCISRGLGREVVSFQPSSWLRSTIDVKWSQDDNTDVDIPVPNHWELASVRNTLDANPRSVASWADVAAQSVERCTNLTFSDNAFDPLRGRPFASGAAERIQMLLNTLNCLKGCFADDGTRTPEGHEIYQNHFTGDKAWFSDSSNSEKLEFKEDLTFPQLGNAGQTLFCTWHGKIKTPQFRVHFSWPVTATDPVYVVYVGPKITKR